ncbi:MAG TPA: AbrB/MazE/SpoVT family DNA-binding domain-containing protein [Lentisphaeria bacterium]|nr:MAG: virulence factor [Lentisphaerae bacterium GWF2_50_93]HCE46805.1 AbrB/MazE/SpoVT family DNA-binding domain-containing protein [Lentisphaeria bacterium]
METATIFKNGGSQAIRLPRGFRFSGKKVYVRHFGGGVLLMPDAKRWSSLFESLSEFTDDFMSERSQPEKHQKRKPL